VPSCLAQWTERQLRRYYADAQGAPRSHRLHGHMAFYPVATRRNRLAHEVARSMPDSDVRLTFGRAYHELGARERFERWRAFKTSLHLPVLGDLSMRVFDALAAGHVPIVPADTRDLDKAIPPAEQRRLPIVRLSEYTVAAVRAAHAEALAAFDAGGEAQAALRHRYVLENHMLGHRVRDIVRHVEAWMTQGASARAW
jgi:hypothetical protein